MSKPKIDLSTLKRLVSELEASIAAADGIATNIDLDKSEYIVELAKAFGLVNGVAIEATYLSYDIHSEVAIQSGTIESAPKQDILSKILGGLKGPGNTN